MLQVAAGRCRSPCALPGRKRNHFDHLIISVEYYFTRFLLLRIPRYFGRLCMFILFHVTIDFAFVILAIDFAVVNFLATRLAPSLAGLFVLFLSPLMGLRFSFRLPKVFLGLPAFTTIELIVDLDTQKPTSYYAIVVAGAALLALDDDSRGEVFELDGGAGFVLMIVTRCPSQVSISQFDIFEKGRREALFQIVGGRTIF